MKPRAEFEENPIPVESILEVLQTSDHPDMSKIDDQLWYEIENSLNKPVTLRRLQRYKPATITPSDKKLSLTFTEEVRNKRGEITGAVEKKKKYIIRKMDTGDILDIASIGPQIVETFFNGDIEEIAEMSLHSISAKVMAKSLSERFRMCMSDLSEQILVKLCDLIVCPKTREPLDYYDDLFTLDPIESMGALKKALEVNTLFFSYLTQQIPENIKSVLSGLTGMLSSNTNPLVMMLVQEMSEQKTETPD